MHVWYRAGALNMSSRRVLSGEPRLWFLPGGRQKVWSHGTPTLVYFEACTTAEESNGKRRSWRIYNRFHPQYVCVFIVVVGGSARGRAVGRAAVGVNNKGKKGVCVSSQWGGAFHQRSLIAKLGGEREGES